MFDSAVMKISVIDHEFRSRYCPRPDHPASFEGKAIVFEGPEDYHDRIEDPSLGIDEHCVLVIRNCGPVGYPGSAEVVNMQPPAALIKAGSRRCRPWATGGRAAPRAAPRSSTSRPRRRSAAAWRC